MANRAWVLVGPGGKIYPLTVCTSAQEAWVNAWCQLTDRKGPGWAQDLRGVVFRDQARARGYSVRRVVLTLEATNGQ